MSPEIIAILKPEIWQLPNQINHHLIKQIATLDIASIKQLLMRLNPPPPSGQLRLKSDPESVTCLLKLQNTCACGTPQTAPSSQFLHICTITSI